MSNEEDKSQSSVNADTQRSMPGNVHDQFEMILFELQCARKELKKIKKAASEQRNADDKVHHLAEKQRDEMFKLRCKVIELEGKVEGNRELLFAAEKKMDKIKSGLEGKEDDHEEIVQQNKFLLMKFSKTNDELQCACKELKSISGRNSQAENDKLLDRITELEVELWLRNRIKLDEKKKVESELQEKLEEIELLEEQYSTVIGKERKANDELQLARKELINALMESTSRAFIGVKRMGQLDITPFRTATRRKFSAQEAEDKAAELCSKWEENLKDSTWHPFRIKTDKRGTTEEVIDDQDEKLKNLKKEYGDEVHDAVVTSITELNECNSSGRYVVPELWNYKEGRKASVTEGVKHILKQLNMYKRRRTC